MIQELPAEVLMPAKTIFKKGAAMRLGEEALEFGNTGIVVYGGSLEKNGKLSKLVAGFPEQARVEWFRRQGGEPTLGEVEELIALAKRTKALWISGVGGGSVLDAAKAAAGLCNAKEKPVYYQEGGALIEAGIPFIAVPTTAGSGSEVTPNAVITNSAKKAKLSIRDKSFLAKKVILDSELLKDIPPRVIAESGMDALVQAYEAYISKNATRMMETIALRAVILLNQNIISAYKTPTDDNLSSMLAGSYYAGMALAHSRLGVIHGIAHPLGALYGIRHGVICAASLPASIKLNKAAMGTKYRTLSNSVGMDFLERSEALLKILSISSPFRGRDIMNKEQIIEETLKSGSTASNPKEITVADVEFMLNELFR